MLNSGILSAGVEVENERRRILVMLSCKNDEGHELLPEFKSSLLRDLTVFAGLPALAGL